MANDDTITARGGMWPVQHPYGNYRKTYYKLQTSGVAVFLGQPMDLNANGRAVPATRTAGAFMVGPVVGFSDANKAGLPSGMDSLTQGGYLPANTEAFVQLADDPEQLFEIQGDTGGTAMTQSDIGTVALMLPRTSSGNTTTGYSTWEIDQSSVVTTTAGNIQILELTDRMNSDGTQNDFGNYAKFTCKVFNHRLQGGSLHTNVI